jgi:VanZ family protein
VRAALACASVVIVAVTLLLGLWPYQPLSSSGFIAIGQTLRGERSFFPENQVRWLGSEPGLQFGEHGSIFSESEFQSSQGKAGCALEIWIEPARKDGQGTVLAFAKGKSETRFRIRQYFGLLMLFRHSSGAAAKEDVIGLDDVMQPGKRVLVTISSNGSEAALYLNGEPPRRTVSVPFGCADMEGLLVVGDSPTGYSTWAGIVSGLALYDGPVSAADAKTHLRAWQTGAANSEGDGPHVKALYLFREGRGNLARSAIPNAPSLRFPKTFKKLRPELLNPVWKEYGTAWDLATDAVVNVVGFVPLGLVVYLFLREGLGVNRSLGATVLAGFAVSLAIELGQYYLPLRSSGTTDLVTNSAGTVCGAMLATKGLTKLALGTLRQVLELIPGKK